jgi:hypothetical protein
MTTAQVTKFHDQAQDVVPIRDPMVSMIERFATDPTADIDKLERMLAAKERMDKQAAVTAFNEALAAAQAKMPNVVAKHNNDQTRSKYAKLADIYNVCKPVAAEYGFSFNVVPIAGGRDGFMNMQWTLRRGAHSESEVSEVPFDDKGMKGTANKTGTHAYGSTTQYARRYLFCAVFDIAIGDDDDGNASGNAKAPMTVSAEQYVALRDKAAEAEVDEAKICLAAGVPDLHQFPASQFDAAMKRLQRNIEQKGGAK